MRITEISSPANSLFKQWCELSSTKGIRKYGEFFLCGEKLIQEFLKSPGSFKIKGEIICEGLTPLTKSSIFKMSKALFNEIDVIGSHYNLLLLELPDFEKFPMNHIPNGLVLVCPLGDPGNLGAVIRSAVAFGIQQIVLTQEAAHPFHPKCVKASAGAILKIHFMKASSLKNFCENQSCIGLDMNGTEISKYKWPKSFYLVVGEEGPGLAQVNIAERVSIQTMNVESLNATVATSLALYEYSKTKNH